MKRTIFGGIGFWMVFTIGGICVSCDRWEEPVEEPKQRSTEEVDEASGITMGFKLESDEMEEDPEVINFNTEDWGEQEMGVEL